MIGQNKNLKKKLKENSELVLGSWLTIPSTVVADVISSSDFDWLAVDMEHTSISIENAADLIRVIDRNGAAPLVRLYDNEPVLIKRVMDLGAAGIIVPMINSVEDVERAYSYMQYPPFGIRGVGLNRAHSYGSEFESYKAWLKNDSVLVAQIEHIDGVKELPKILASRKVDAFIVGPYDLSASLGKPGDFESKDFIAAMEEINRVGLESGVAFGFHVVEPDVKRVKELSSQKIFFNAFSVDFRILDSVCRDAQKILRSKS